MPDRVEIEKLREYRPDGTAYAVTFEYVCRNANSGMSRVQSRTNPITVVTVTGPWRLYLCPSLCLGWSGNNCCKTYCKFFSEHCQDAPNYYIDARLTH